MRHQNIVVDTGDRIAYPSTEEWNFTPRELVTMTNMAMKANRAKMFRVGIIDGDDTFVDKDLDLCAVVFTIDEELFEDAFITEGLMHAGYGVRIILQKINDGNSKCESDPTIWKIIAYRMSDQSNVGSLFDT